MPTLAIWKPIALVVLLFLLVAASEQHRQSDIGVSACTARFRSDSKAFAARIRELTAAIRAMDGDAQPAMQKLKEARIAYKNIEYFLEYFFFTSSRIYNRPPKNEIEEPHLEYMEPAGLQYIEALLADEPLTHKEELLQQCRLVETGAADLPALLFNFQATDAQVLESVRTELVRVMTLGITGFDAPVLKSGPEESASSLETMRAVLNPYLLAARNDSVSHYLNTAIIYLNQNKDFDKFDRLHFLTSCALPLQKHLSGMIRGLGLEINRQGILNYRAQHLFSPDALLPEAFDKKHSHASPEEVELGKKLFFETKLSANGTRSCASCHNPALHFTDGLPKSAGLAAGQFVRRNAPTLLYAGFQHAQFWDGRATALEDQVHTVIADSIEMQGDARLAIRKLARTRSYRKLLRKVCPDRDSLSEKVVFEAIAAYVRTLQPFNSDFDRYIAGDRTALTERQISGFNLFMGKAQCGTCHFAPLFNGLIPPRYTLTEFEVLGTTATDDLSKPEADSDPGRFESRPTPYFRGAFKTPTVRNSAVTAPYMHNGAFASLEKVIDFYDKGGASGLGIETPFQTLSANPLQLTDQEKSDIVDFLHSLTDRL